MDIKEIHKNVLQVINEEGHQAGIRNYRLHAKLYDDLPDTEAPLYWRDILTAIDAKVGLGDTIVIEADDPFMGPGAPSLDSLDFKEVEEYRKTHYKHHEKLDSKMFYFMLKLHEDADDLIARKDQLPRV